MEPKANHTIIIGDSRNMSELKMHYRQMKPLTELKSSMILCRQPGITTLDFQKYYVVDCNTGDDKV